MLLNQLTDYFYNRFAILSKVRNKGAAASMPQITKSKK